jgi:hypothetical protein
MVRYTIDTSFAVKGLIPPRRKKQDDFLAQQQRLYEVARDHLDKVRCGEVEIFLPAIALIETGIVV